MSNYAIASFQEEKTTVLIADSKSEPGSSKQLLYFSGVILYPF